MVTFGTKRQYQKDMINRLERVGIPGCIARPSRLSRNSSGHIVGTLVARPTIFFGPAMLSDISLLIPSIMVVVLGLWTDIQL
jgi:hypothetical protein